MKIRTQFTLFGLLTAGFVVVSVAAFSQERRERTIDEIKTEAVHRAEIGRYPLIGLDPGDAGIGHRPNEYSRQART